LVIEVVQVIANDPDCIPTAVVVTWTDLGETYQLERSTDGVNWSIIYTGTAFTKNESFGNADATYMYRVKVLFSDLVSNVSAVTPKEQNKLTYDNCYPAFNVAPYTWRVQRRTLCETYNNTDTVDLARCCLNKNEITFDNCLSAGNAPYTWRTTRYNNCTGVYTNTDTDGDDRCKPDCNSITGATVSFGYACNGGDCDHSLQGFISVAFVSGTPPTGAKVGDTIGIGATDHVNAGSCFPGGCSINYTRVYSGYTFKITGFNRMNPAQGMTWTINSITITGCS